MQGKRGCLVCEMFSLFLLFFYKAASRSFFPRQQRLLWKTSKQILRGQWQLDSSIFKHTCLKMRNTSKIFPWVSLVQTLKPENVLGLTWIRDSFPLLFSVGFPSSATSRCKGVHGVIVQHGVHQVLLVLLTPGVVVKLINFSLNPWLGSGT